MQSIGVSERIERNTTDLGEVNEFLLFYHIRKLIKNRLHNSIFTYKN